MTKFDGVRFTHFTEKEGFINNSVWSIMKDHNGNIWAGTDRGVTRIDGINFTYYTEKEGLIIIRSIVSQKIKMEYFGLDHRGAVFRNLTEVTLRIIQ
jgi:ligand-binding sensor domain-containing protein